MTDDITDHQGRRETSQPLILIHIILLFIKKNKIVFHLYNVAVMCLGFGWFYLSECSSTFVSQVKDAVSSLSGQICLELYIS